MTLVSLSEVEESWPSLSWTCMGATKKRPLVLDLNPEKLRKDGGWFRSPRLGHFVLAAYSDEGLANYIFSRAVL